MTRRTDITLGRLSVPAPSKHDAQGFARDVAQNLMRSLPDAGVSGDIPHVRVTLSSGEARDPAAVAAAVLRAITSGARR